MWRDAVMARVGAMSHPAWGPEHCRRLYMLCRHIIETDGLEVDDDVVFAVAWLHDIGNFGQFVCDGGPPECAALAAQQLLPGSGFPEHKVELVARIIKEHSFEGPRRDTDEASVVRDADMLEFLGAVGLVRLLSIVELEEWVPDPRTAMALAMQFSDDLPPKLTFEASRKIADQRATETLDFVGALSYETAELQVI